MNEALLISNVLLWAVVVVMAGVIVVLVRQVGVLYERVAPAGALVMGRTLAVGAPAPVVPAETVDGATRVVGAASPAGRGTLLFFLSPTCPVCKTLLPALRSLARSEAAWLDVVLASDGPRDEHTRFVREQRLEEFPYLLSAPLGVQYQVGKLPYAVLIDGSGVVRATGLVNTREHLESLLEARERGVASIQDWMSDRASQAGAA